MKVNCKSIHTIFFENINLWKCFILFFFKRSSFNEKYSILYTYKLSIKSEIPSNVNLFSRIQILFRLTVHGRYLRSLKHFFSKCSCSCKTNSSRAISSCATLCSEISLVREIARQRQSKTVMNNTCNAPSKLVNFHPGSQRLITLISLTNIENFIVETNR